LQSIQLICRLICEDIDDAKTQNYPPLMKPIFYALFILLVTTGCSKNNSVEPPVVNTADFTDVPSSTPVSTSLMVYAMGNSQLTNPLYISTNNIYLDYIPGNDGFVTNRISIDKYSSTLALSPQLSYNYGGAGTFKTFPVTNALRNYVDIKILPLTGVGGFQLDNGSGNFPLPGGGEIDLPSYSLGAHAGGIGFNVAASYLHPSNNDYAVSLPCYAMGDDKGKRWFLNSYGAYFLVPQISNVADQAIDFNPAVNVLLKVPITAGQLTNSPDSIAVWNINTNHVWQLNGYAHKKAGFYETKITHRGFWNIAVPLNGVYVTVHLRTPAGMPVLNTRIKIKNNNNEIADIRTDAEGNAIIFVPTKIELSADVINDHYGNWSSIIAARQSLGSFNSATEKTIVVADRADLPTFEGSVFNCDGSILSSGTAVITNIYAKDSYTFAISNGKFKGSTWINYGNNFPDLRILDDAGNVLSTNKMALAHVSPTDVDQGIKKYQLNYYGCENAASVYCNYTVDTTHYRISAGAAASNPVLTETSYPSSLDIIAIEDINGKGITFQGWFSTVFGNYFSGGGINLPTGLKINGVERSLEANSDIIITRHDTFISGYVEGWFLVYYKDNNNTLHKVTGNFRVKKLA
jgi:hypothetical protein